MVSCVIIAVSGTVSAAPKEDAVEQICRVRDMEMLLTGSTLFDIEISEARFCSERDRCGDDSFGDSYSIARNHG